MLSPASRAQGFMLSLRGLWLYAVDRFAGDDVFYSCGEGLLGRVE